MDRPVLEKTSPFLPRLSVLAIATALVLSAPARSSERKPLPTRQPNLEIMKCAHRGVLARAPENTLPAIQRAIEMGYDYVEIDVRYSKDGVPILMHDDWLTRTTGAFGPPGWYELDTLKLLTAGFPRSPKWWGTEIPTVEEALSLMQGEIRLYLDQKEPPTPELISLLKEYGFYPNEMVVVGGGPRQKKFIEYEPDAPVMPKMHSVEDVDRIVAEFPSAAAVNSDCREITPEMVEAAHARGLMVFTNTLSMSKSKAGPCMRKAIMAGSDVLQFDYPVVFARVLEQVRRETLKERNRIEGEPPGGYLCEAATDPESAPDKVLIDCEVERGDFAGAPPSAAGGLKIAAYNLERGMYLEEQIDVLREHPDFRDAHVLLISEADRYCSRAGYRNVSREMARALDMNYAFAVEYVELPRRTDEPVNAIETVCEHGNAVMSRYPIAAAGQIRHEQTSGWYLPPGPEREGAEPRLGGVITTWADVVVDGATVRVYAAHFDSDITREDVRNRTAQAKDLVEHASGIDYPVVIGGDLNTIGYTVELTAGLGDDKAVAALEEAGFVDAHGPLPRRERGTTGRDYLVRGIIDLIFARGARVIEQGRCEPGVCGHLSDHLPVYAVIEPPE